MHATQATLPFPGPPRASAAARGPGASLQSVKVSGDLLFIQNPCCSKFAQDLPTLKPTFQNGWLVWNAG